MKEKSIGSRRIIVVFAGILLVYIALSSFLYVRWNSHQSKKSTGVTSKIVKFLSWRNSPAPIQEVKGNLSQVVNEPEEEVSPEAKEEIDHIINEQMRLKGNKDWVGAWKMLEVGFAKYSWSDKLATHKGGWFFDQGNWTMAEYWYKVAHTLNKKEPSYAMNVGLCLINQGKEYESIDWYKIAYDIKPHTNQLIGFVNMLWKFNNWTNYEEYEEKIVMEVRQEIKDGRRASIGSYVALHLPFTLAELREIAHSDALQIEAAAKSPKDPFTFRNDHDRIRVGYVSYDLRYHAVGLQVQSMFGFHNRDKFEVFVYNTNDGLKDPYIDSDVWKKINRTVEHAVELGKIPVNLGAERINNDSIDILIDLNLFTAHHRMDIFSVRPSPIQVAYLGLATTTGANWMDYVVVDHTVVPIYQAQHFSEKLIYMPFSYHIFDHKQNYGIKEPFQRMGFGLPEKKILFCNHQNNQRLYPEAFDHFANIVKVVENSSIVLKFYNDYQANNMKENARQRGLIVSDDPNESQLIFMHGTGDGSHIQMKAMCDVYLDMHNYNGHSTGGDMLWAGVPVVTFPGESMASRAGASFAKTMGFPELIANSWEEFEKIAIELGTNHDKYHDIRSRLEASRVNSPLFDTARWVRDFEFALEKMYDMYRKGEPKNHVVVPKDH